MARKNFNSQPHKEADKAEGYAYNDMEHFNSQPHKEADRDLTKTKEKFETFQLTASQGG